MKKRMDLIFYSSKCVFSFFDNKATYFLWANPHKQPNYLPHLLLGCGVKPYICPSKQEHPFKNIL